MQKMSPIAIALNIRSGRIPVRWTVREGHWAEGRGADGKLLWPGGKERVFWPEVIQTAGVVKVREIDEPLDLRARLFKAFNTNWSESTALDILDRVGAWRAAKATGNEQEPEGRRANVAYGHRLELNLCVSPVTLDQLRSDTERWYRLSGVLGNPAKLRAEFKEPPNADSRPHDLVAFAGDSHFNNTLRVSMEWHGKAPRAVVETITAWELMVATAWADVVGKVEPQVCAYCGTRFTSPRIKTHCLGECAHLFAVRAYKRRKALEKKKEKEQARTKK
jgi:hypothetical protein